MARPITLQLLAALFLVGWVQSTQDYDKASIFRSPLTDGEMRTVAEEGYSYVDRLAQIEEDLYAQGVYVKEDSHLYRMSQFKRPSREAIEMNKKSMQLIETTRLLKDRVGLENVEWDMATMRESSLVDNTCLVPPVCKPSKYRTMDGSCNNLAITNLGQSLTDYRRLAPPVYPDGIQEPRTKSINGSLLPSPRLISTDVFSTAKHDMHAVLSFSLVQFGQLINHDMQLTNQIAFSDGTGITCCTKDNKMLPPSQLNPACFPIRVPDSDRFVNRKAVVQTCMNFVRSITGPRLNCSQALGYADQLNSNTHWLDGSTIYGSNDATMKSLRANTGGLLLMSTDTGFNGQPRSLLPVTPGCTNGACFFAGDPRVIEQPQLALMHTIWAREHNRVAKALAALNPAWSDEALFQEARRIVIAELQHITFNEFLPALLSHSDDTEDYFLDDDTVVRQIPGDAMSFYGLYPLKTGFFTKSETLTSGPISTEFSTAAFRMGHSLVPGFMELYDEDGVLLPTSYNMSTTFNDASKIVKDKAYFDAAIRGMAMEPSRKFDRYFSRDLWLELFKEASAQFGFDIVALNIQRGRDHGLPTYNTYRQFCGFSKLTSFDQMINPLKKTDPFASSKLVRRIKLTYASVEDIDLFTGLLSERRDPIGPTTACLIGENFQKLKYGDRFFYERGGEPHSFTAAQLDEIRKTTLARIYCDNNDGSILGMQPNVFYTPTTTNARVLCSNVDAIPSVNLNLWKDEPLF